MKFIQRSLVHEDFYLEASLHASQRIIKFHLNFSQVELTIYETSNEPRFFASHFDMRWIYRKEIHGSMRHRSRFQSVGLRKNSVRTISI